MKKSIVWLASYPKSGNTWTRIFLANYFANQNTPLSINQADKFGFGDSGTVMYRRAAGQDIDHENKRLTLSLRERVIAAIVGNNADFNFIKTHNVNSVAFGVDLIPTKFTRCAIYIVRNPLDVVLSYARHYGATHEIAVDRMARSDNVTKATKLQVTQYIASWSDHVSSWSAETRFPVLVVRYEDMLSDPVGSFRSMVEHTGLPIDEPRLENAVRFSSFDEVSKQEQEGGFKEASPNTDRFFTAGRTGRWMTDLEPELAKKVKKQHRKMMKKFGYLE